MMSSFPVRFLEGSGSQLWNSTHWSCQGSSEMSRCPGCCILFTSESLGCGSSTHSYSSFLGNSKEQTRLRPTGLGFGLRPKHGHVLKAPQRDLTARRILRLAINKGACVLWFLSNNNSKYLLSIYYVPITVYPDEEIIIILMLI